MLGLFVEILLSWIVLRIFEKRGLEALGIKPDYPRLFHLIAGAALAAVLMSGYFGLQTLFSGGQWLVNLEYSWREALSGITYTLKSVLYEELIFRGALLYIAIRKIGELKGCALSAIAFGIYHWFSYGVIGNVIPMIYIFLITGAGGLAFAWAFAKTNSLYLPIGLHLGSNLVSIILFSQGPLGNQLLIPDGGSSIAAIPSLFLFLFQVLVLPVAVFFYLKYFNKPNPALKKKISSTH